MRVTLNHLENRRQSIIGWQTCLAISQGYGPAEARQRAEAQQDLDEAWTNRQLTIHEGLSASGWEPGDWSRVCDGSMPTEELTALVGFARALPRDGTIPSYIRHGWTAGPHGLF